MHRKRYPASAMSFPYYHGGRIYEVSDFTPPTPPDPPDPPEGEETVYVRFYDYSEAEYTYFTMTGSVASGWFEGNGHQIEWVSDESGGEWIYTAPIYGVATMNPPRAQTQDYFDDIFTDVDGPMFDAYCKFTPHE